MKRTFFTIGIILSSFSYIQASEVTRVEIETPSPKSDIKEASFPGGSEAFTKYLIENLNYPKTSLDKGEQGKVFVKFIVNEDGSISNPQVVRGATDELNNEALRLISKMPNWEPAEANGKAVKSEYTLPISFALN